jgi:hypothetical protein
VSITTLANCRVDVVGVGRVELVRVEAAGCSDDEARGTARVAVASFGVVPLVCDGEEDFSNGPLAVCFGWLILCAASKARAAFAVLNDLRRRCPSGSRQSAKNLLALMNIYLLGSGHLLDTLEFLVSSVFVQ